MSGGLWHECGVCSHWWRTTSFSTECPKCGSMKGMARSDADAATRKQKKHSNRYDAIVSFRSDELAELMVMYEGGMLEKFL